MKTKKKFGFVQVLLVILLLVMVATYFIKDRSDTISYLAFGDALVDYVQSFYYFFDVIIFMLVVGGLYGALNKVYAYKKLVKMIAEKVEDKKKLFIIVVTILFALLTSLGGLNTIVFVFIPFVISIMLVLGYDKLVALSSTVLATMVGFIGGVFVTFKDSSSQYTTSYTTFDKMVGISGNFGNVLPKVLLLVVGTLLLVLFILNHIKKVESKEEKDELGSNDVFLVETKNNKTSNMKDVKVWPMALMLGILLVILILGYLPWNDLFGIKCFDKFHEWLTGLKIGKYEVFNSLISSNFAAFGKWSNLGNFMMVIVCIAVFIFILKFVFGVKFTELMNGFVYGVKKMIIPVMIIALAYTVLVTTYNNGFMETVIKAAKDSFGDNVIVSSAIVLIGSIFSVDTYYSVVGIFSPIVSNLGDKANLNIYAILFQSIFGLVQMCGPTSILLIAGLSYLDVPYSKWLKYVWRFVLYMLILIFIVLMIVSVL